MSKRRSATGDEPLQLGCGVQFLLVCTFVLIFVLACILIGTGLRSASG